LKIKNQKLKIENWKLNSFIYLKIYQNSFLINNYWNLCKNYDLFEQKKKKKKIKNKKKIMKFLKKKKKKKNKKEWRIW